MAKLSRLGYLIFCLASQCLFAGPLYPIAEMKACDESSAFEEVELRDFQREIYKVQWTVSAGEKCPGPKFPRIVLKNSKVNAYLHLVSVNTEVPPNLGSDPSWNPWGLRFPWTFLDIGEDSRKNRNPFYSRGAVFHDNPKWGTNYMKWTGSIYGVKTTTNGSWSPVLGIGWGFAIKNNRVMAVHPSSLNKNDWFRDFATFSKVLERWKRKKIKINRE